MKSILQREKQCYITGSTNNLHEHHIFEGTANRKKSEQYGLKVWLRADWHNMSNYGVHFDKELNLWLKEIGQRKFEETHTREFFIKEFGRSYL